ncbi:MAG: C2 family cysteine protease [Elainellaceae cyanobacterium]
MRLAIYWFHALFSHSCCLGARYEPTDALGRLVYAKTGGSSYRSTDNELWVALAEKAYAQLNESGWIGQDGTNSYTGTNLGYSSATMRQVTAQSTISRRLDTASTPNSLVDAFNSGQLTALTTKGSSEVAPTLVPDHSYTLIEYEASTQRFTLFNPWGLKGGYSNGRYIPGTIQLGWDEIVQNFTGYVYTLS